MLTDKQKTALRKRKQAEKGNAYARLVEQKIEALFAASRDAEGDEVGPYARLALPSGDHNDWVYTVFSGNGERDEFAEPDRHRVERIEDEADFIVTAVQRQFPSHITQRLIWRKRPVFEIIPAQKAEKKFGIEARPATQQIYCRLVGVPMDAEFVGKWREGKPRAEYVGPRLRPLRVKT